MSEPLLIAICGPRGAGKDTLLAILRDRFSRMKRLLTRTTRAPRTCEENGKDYTFTSNEEFQKMLDAGKFLFDFQLNSTHRYGTITDEFVPTSEGIVANVAALGARALKKRTQEVIPEFFF